MSEYQEDEDSLSLALTEKRLFRISYEYSVPDTTPLVLRFISPCNFILHSQVIAVDANDVKYEAVVNGTPSGSFSTPLTIWALNRMSDTLRYKRDLPPGDYYLRITASGGTATGTLALLWEERP